MQPAVCNLTKKFDTFLLYRIISAERFQSNYIFSSKTVATPLLMTTVRTPYNCTKTKASLIYHPENTTQTYLLVSKMFQYRSIS